MGDLTLEIFEFWNQLSQLVIYRTNSFVSECGRQLLFIHFFTNIRMGKIKRYSAVCAAKLLQDFDDSDIETSDECAPGPVGDEGAVFFDSRNDR